MCVPCDRRERSWVREGGNILELGQGIRERRSVRKFRETKIPREVFRKIIETASYAPSWKNSQPVRYLVVDDEKKIRELARETCMQGFAFNSKTLSGASAAVILTVEKGLSGYEKDGTFSTSKGRHWQSFDAGIAAQTFCLAAWEQGIGTVIMGIFDEKEVEKVVPVPDGHEIAAVIAAGYPAVSPDAPAKKRVEELAVFL